MKNMNCSDFDHKKSCITFPMFLPTNQQSAPTYKGIWILNLKHLGSVRMWTLKCATICIEIIFVFTRLAWIWYMPAHIQILLFVCILLCYTYVLTFCLPLDVGCCWSWRWSCWTRWCTPCEEVDLSKGSRTLLSGKPSFCPSCKIFAWAAMLVR